MTSSQPNQSNMRVFIVFALQCLCPPDLGGKLDDDQFKLERSFFQRKLGRIVEFCRMAKNGPEAMQLLRDLRLDYNLLADVLHMKSRINIHQKIYSHIRQVIR